MAKTKTNLKERSAADLHKDLAADRTQLRELRFGLPAGQVKQVREVRRLRRGIARILTELKRRHLEAAAAPAAEKQAEPAKAQEEKKAA